MFVNNMRLWFMVRILKLTRQYYKYSLMNLFFRRGILAGILVLFSTTMLAKGIKGAIIDDLGNHLPGTSIFIKEIQAGITTNVNGYYEINLDEGIYTVSFQALGFFSQEHTVKISGDWLNFDITMRAIEFQLKEVQIYAGEDPAYKIMRKAISMAPYYLVQAKGYEAEVYLKGSFVVKKMPKLLEKQITIEAGGKNSNDFEIGKTYTSESMNDIRFAAPDTFVHTVKAARNSFPGDLNGESTAFGFINASLYDSSDEIISPLSPNAMRHYNFRYEGFFDDGKYTVNKIKVIPKRKSQQLFAGYIYIVEKLWNIHSVDLTIEPFFGKVNMKQQYREIKDRIWLPISHIFNMELGMMGIKADVDYMGTVKYLSVNLNNVKVPALLEKEYVAEDNAKQVAESAPEPVTEQITRNQKKIEKILEKDELSNRDMMRLAGAIEKENKPKREETVLEIKNNYKFEIKKDSIIYDSLVWKAIRPVPLTKEEQTGFAIRDSLARLDAVETESDTTKAKPVSKFRLSSEKILTGGRFTRNSSKVSVYYGGLFMIDGIGFNPVDGWKYKQNLDIGWKQDSVHSLNFSTNVGYAFARRSFYGNVGITQTYSPMRRGLISLTGDFGSRDFNSESTIHPLLDLGASLLFKENYLRYFDNKSVEIKNLIDITNGLRMEIAGSYQQAAPLENNTNFSFFRRDRDYHLNEVLSNPGINASHFEKQEALTAKLKFSYTPMQYYVIRNGRKEMRRSDYPTFSAGLEQGIKVSSNSADYLLADVRAFKRHGFALQPTFSWDVNAGWFIRNNRMHFSQFRHFSASTIPVSFQDFGSQFVLIDNYQASTNKWYAKASGTFSTPYMLLKFLPFLSNRLWNENIHVSHLHTPDFRHYTQIGYSLSQIFMVGNIGVFAGFSEFNYQHWGVRVSFLLY